VLDPLRGSLHGLGDQAAAVNAAVNFTLEEAGRFEDAEMLGDGGERERERLGELGDSGFALSKASEDGAAGGIGEGGEGGVERGGGIVNHMVYYCRGACGCQANFWGAGLRAERWTARGWVGDIGSKSPSQGSGLGCAEAHPYNGWARLQLRAAVA
jgi:hypothetical protein